MPRSGAIEIAQLWVPGRHARLIDFLVDTTAACIGIGLVRVVIWLKGIGTYWELGGQRRNSGPRSRADKCVLATVSTETTWPPLRSHLGRLAKQDLR